MFNQLTPAEVVTAIGATLRSAARTEGPTSDFDRDQLLSAYSATRHLSVELAAYGPELDRFAEVVAGEVRSAGGVSAGDDVARLGDRIGDTRDPGAIGEALCELFDILRRDPSQQAQALRSELHAQLRSLADREVDLLADRLG